MQSKLVQLLSDWIGSAKTCAFLFPLLAVLVVFLGHDYYRGALGLRDQNVDLCVAEAASSRCSNEHPFIAIRNPGSNIETAVLDLDGRLQLSTAMDLFLATFAILLCNCLLVVARCRNPHLGYRQLALLTVVVGMIVYIHNGYDTRQFSLLLHSFDVVVSQTMPKTTMELLGADHLVSALAMFSSVVLAVTFATIIEGLSQPARSVADPSAKQGNLDDIKMRCAALRATLVTGAAVLAAAVIYLHALQNWALAFVENADSIRGMANQWAVSLGTYWTLVLAAAYVPGALILYRATHFLAHTRETSGAQKQTDSIWLESNGLSVSVKGQILQVVALLAPWLIGGPLPELAKLLNA